MSRTTHQLHFRPDDVIQLEVHEYKIAGESQFSIRLAISDKDGHLQNDGSEPVFQCRTVEQVRAFVPGWHASTEEDPPLDEQLVKLADALVANAGPAALSRLLDRLEDKLVQPLEPSRCNECGGEIDESGVCPPCYEESLRDADANRRLSLLKEGA